MNYPNTCDTCQKCTATPGKGCDKWKMRFRVIWKQFNSYQIRQYKKQQTKNTKFCYEHPDIVRNYLKNGPCKGCEFEVLCDVPCSAYWHWWDAKMAALKERYGGK